MKQVSEIMYIVPEEREKFLDTVLNPTQETKEVLWLCGVRDQVYYAVNELIVMVFMYEGNHFYEDLDKMSAYLEGKGILIEKRRRDVPASEQKTTNWWAPLKKLGTILEESPFTDEDEDSFEEQYHSMRNGGMQESGVNRDFSYDEDDWSESIHI